MKGLFVLEMIEMIIDDIQDDWTTLHACCLVSKAWISRSRRYLFQEVALDSFVTFSKFLAILPSVSKPGEWVRTLTVEEEDNPWVVRALQAMVRYLPSIVELCLSGDFTSWVDVAHSIGTFSSLRAVSLDYLGWVQERGVCMARVPLQLERMAMRACQKREVMEWITSAEGQPQLREVVVLDLCEPELNAFNHFLRRLGDNLEALTFATRADEEFPPDILQKINLQYNTKLKTIIIDDLFPMTGDETSQTLSGLISRITSPYLNEITFSIHCQEAEELQSIDWKSIDMKLSDPRFERLKKVIVRVWGGVESEVVRSFLDAHLWPSRKENCFILIINALIGLMEVPQWPE